MILNLGCGNLPVHDAVNVDLMKGPYVDEALDLRHLPWKWKSGSVDGIYMFSTLEHFEDPLAIFAECHRILKKGGFLFVTVPHSSSVGGVGNMGHYWTFSYHTFYQYLNRAFYPFDKAIFKTQMLRIHWWTFERTSNNPYGIKFKVDMPVSAHPFLYRCVLVPLDYVISGLIRLAPIVFERFWCYYVGGADEVVWKGTKI